MFLKRLISGIILVALALLLIIIGGNVLLFATLAISLIGLFEFYRAFEIEKTFPAITGYIVTVLYYLFLGFFRDLPLLKGSGLILFVGFLIVLLAAYVLTYPKYDIKKISAAFFGVFYVAVMLSFLWRTRVLDHGIYTVWLILLASWGSDTFAYCVGVLFGKHKMAPLLSPKKSIEGAIGGVAGAILLTAIYLSIFMGQMHISPVGVFLLSLSAGAGALFSMAGDLAASAVKRDRGIKDYGKLIPGHGGILDRFDSILITAPVIYYFSEIIMQWLRIG